MPFHQIILASQSPRRAALLHQLGLRFEVVESGVDEPDRLEGEPATDWVQRSSALKAQAVARAYPEAVVIGADTAVIADDDALGKPQDAEEAERMLDLLSGRTHHVLTGVTVSGPAGRSRSACERTEVTFRSLSPEEIRAYVRSGEPMDKAGAYGIQGRAAVFVTRIAGCYFNVVGLPLALLAEMLEDVKVLVYRQW